jgi:hypothetical protein
MIEPALRAAFTAVFSIGCMIERAGRTADGI